MSLNCIKITNFNPPFLRHPGTRVPLHYLATPLLHLLTPVLCFYYKIFVVVFKAALLKDTIEVLRVTAKVQTCR